MFARMSEILEIAAGENIPISEVMVRQEVAETGRTREEVLDRMREHVATMETAAEEGLQRTDRSLSGLSGGDARRLHDHLASGRSLLGPQGGLAASLALAVSETNARMGRIVATPTAGSAGILPGVLFALRERLDLDTGALVAGALTAAAIGLVIANSATIAGASGGCQAEVGSATAMAAGAAVELAGGDPDQVSQAVAIALENVLGLVCDPVAGLVEVPCIVRNGVHAVMALTAADMALAGVRSVIPADEVIAAMNAIGHAMPRQFKETALGGLAITPTAIRLRDRIREQGQGQKAPGEEGR